MPNFPHKYSPFKPNHVPPEHAPGVRERLLSCSGAGDEFDRHVMSCVLAAAMAEREYHPLTEALGLTRETIAEILASMFPGSYDIDEIVPGDAGTGEDAIEEPLLRQMLLLHRTEGAPMEEWLAHIFVRRCQAGDHMWRSIGIFSREELTGAMLRYFKPLASKNVHDLKWKRFIYRQMREDKDLGLNKYPFCDYCPDLEECVATEN